MYSCEITRKKNNLLEDEIKVQIRIPIWPSQIPHLAIFLYGQRHLAYTGSGSSILEVEQIHMVHKQVLECLALLEKFKADDILINVFYLFLPWNRIWHFM